MECAHESGMIAGEAQVEGTATVAGTATQDEEAIVTTAELGTETTTLVGTESGTLVQATITTDGDEATVTT
jgi:hypothetical protein